MYPVIFDWAGELWFWLAQGDGAAVLLGAALLVFTAILGIVWRSRARSARRFHAALDAYAEREIDRTRRRNGPQRVRGGSTRGDALPGGSTHGGWTIAHSEDPFPRAAAAFAVRQQPVATKGEER
jgi:hypothetical protein